MYNFPSLDIYLLYCFSFILFKYRLSILLSIKNQDHRLRYIVIINAFYLLMKQLLQIEARIYNKGLG